MLTNLCEYSRYTAGDYAGQILQQCMDMIRYQPPATNLTVPTSAGYGENVTPGAVTAGDREQELWRRQLQVRCSVVMMCDYCAVAGNIVWRGGGGEVGWK